MTTTVDDRLADIYRRYGSEHVVARSIREAEPIIRAVAQRTDERLRNQVK
ncbi:hypothetical protein [Nocardia farcinica]|nr:hypothetical protein [Nocardia farcinica]MBF6520579.1 hypothetical protein [Nocardia farcinica]